MNIPNLKYKILQKGCALGTGKVLKLARGLRQYFGHKKSIFTLNVYEVWQESS